MDPEKPVHHLQADDLAMGIKTIKVEIPLGAGAANAERRIREALARAARRGRKPRKPSVGTLIAQAEKKGKTVTSITTPDGTVLNLGEPQPTEANNPWLADLHKVTKQ